jgi:hypothetical protein
MKTKIIIASATAALTICCTSSVFSRNYHPVPIKTLRDKTMVTVQIGDKTIPDILLDTGFDYDGIIGYSLFGHYVVEIDYNRGELFLHDHDTFKPDTGFTRVPLYFKDNRIPWMDAAVVISNEDPVNVSAYIDFANRDPVVLLERPEMKFNLPESTEQKVIGRGLSGGAYGSTGRISKLIIGS